MAPAGLPGRPAPGAFGCTAAGPMRSFSLSSLMGRSSPRVAIRWLLLAFSCVCLNLSSSSPHLTLPSSSLAFRPMRFRVSPKLLPGVPDGVPLPLEDPTSELFCLKWFRVGEEEGWTYGFARGAMCR
jgi:hypothetical protein